MILKAEAGFDYDGVHVHARWPGDRAPDVPNRRWLLRLAQLGLTPEQVGDDYHVPTIRLDESRGRVPTTTDKETLTFRLEAFDTRETLDRLHVWVNGVPVYGLQGRSLKDANAKEWRGEVTVTLSSGRNRVQAAVMNRQLAESRKETFEVVNTESNKFSLVSFWL